MPLVPKLDMLNSHLAFGAGIAVMFGAAGFLAQGRPAHPLSSILWAAAGVLTPVIALIALYYGIVDFERSIPFAAIALLLAVLFAYRDRHARQARHRARRRGRNRDLSPAAAWPRWRSRSPSRWKEAGSRSRSP